MNWTEFRNQYLVAPACVRARRGEIFYSQLALASELGEAESVETKSCHKRRKRLGAAQPQAKRI